MNSSFVGDVGTDGLRQIKAGEQVVITLNGREYVIEATADGLTTNEITNVANTLINSDPEILADFEPLNGENYNAFIRGSLVLKSLGMIQSIYTPRFSTNGDLLVYGTVGKTYRRKLEYLTHWDPNHYYPNQIKRKNFAN